MSRKMNRRDFLKGTALTALGLAATGVAAGAVAEEKPGYIPGTYSATVKGMNDVTVTATFSESAITEVAVDTSAETAGIGKELGEKFAAQIMERQSAEVDAVGGATMTTNAVREALTQCIAQAKGVDLSAAAEQKESNVSTDPKFWLGDAPVIPEDAIAETLYTELLVIGSGHSGLMCARKAAELAKAQYHKIKSGDTLGALAVKYHTTVKAICNLNGITPKTTLRIGRSLRVR